MQSERQDLNLRPLLPQRGNSPPEHRFITGDQAFSIIDISICLQYKRLEINVAACASAILAPNQTLDRVHPFV